MLERNSLFVLWPQESINYNVFIMESISWNCNKYQLVQLRYVNYYKKANKLHFNANSILIDISGKLIFIFTNSQS